MLHGGLFSRDDVTLSELESIDRNKEPPESGVMCEILWSDPHPLTGRRPSQRGVGIAFGEYTHHSTRFNSHKSRT